MLILPSSSQRLASLLMIVCGQNVMWQLRTVSSTFSIARRCTTDLKSHPLVGSCTTRAMGLLILGERAVMPVHRGGDVMEG